MPGTWTFWELPTSASMPNKSNLLSSQDIQWHKPDCQSYLSQKDAAMGAEFLARFPRMVNSQLQLFLQNVAISNSFDRDKEKVIFPLWLVT